MACVRRLLEVAQELFRIPFYMFPGKLDGRFCVQIERCFVLYFPHNRKPAVLVGGFADPLEQGFG